MVEINKFLQYMGFMEYRCRYSGRYWQIPSVPNIYVKVKSYKGGIYTIAFSRDSGRLYRKVDTYWVNVDDGFDTIKLDILEKLTNWV